MIHMEKIACEDERIKLIGFVQVIFVVDATDRERINTSKEELTEMLNEEELAESALLVFANKQDQVR